MRWIAALAVVLLATACSGDEGPPTVNWGQIPSAQRATIDRVVDSGDCAGMQAAFNGSEDADVLSYLDWHMRDAECY